MLIYLYSLIIVWNTSYNGEKRATTFYFVPTGITETAVAYKTASNWRLTPPVTCGTGTNLVCTAVSLTSVNTMQLVLEIDNAGSTAAEEISYTRSLATSFKN